MNKVFTVLGAIALTFTLSMAAEMKCEAGKCGGDKSKTEMKCGSDKNKTGMKCQAGKCGGDMAQEAPKASKKAKCGQGKCGQ